MSESARELAEGELVDGRFLIEAKVGEGSQGAVYRVRDLDERRACAVKFLDAAPDDSDSHARFEREGRLGLNLRHSALVEVYDAGKRWCGIPYFAMQLLEGMGPLGEHWARLGWSQFLAIVEQVASALDYLAGYDLVHRDLSPWNILVGDDGRVKVIDLGLAREVGSNLTRTSMVDVMGSPGYLPPEQLDRAKDAEPRSDQWALAAIVYEALTGTPPHLHGDGVDDDTEVLALQRVADGTPVLHPAELNSSVSEELGATVMRALSQDPGGRFPNATAFVATLSDARAQGLVLPRQQST